MQGILQRRFLLLAAAVLGIGAVAGCGPRHAETVAEDGPRIVSFLPSGTETLFALGLGDCVVGRSRFCDFPPEAAALPVVGDLFAANEDALAALANHVGVSPAELYDAASFYSMLRFDKPAAVEVRVCRGTACHSGGNAELVAALEAATGIRLGESNEAYSLGWVECLGQCQAAPNLLINGALYTNVKLDKIPELLGGAK